MDSGAFSTILQHGGYPSPVSVYAKEIRYWQDTGNLLAAVSEDYMCEPDMLKKTGLTVDDHQRLTIERYDELLTLVDYPYILPVLQGYKAEAYIHHIRLYGKRLPLGAWVGVGSICKRNGNPAVVAHILQTIHQERSDLRLHGFGLKITSLTTPEVRQELTTADSLAWSFWARRNNQDQNSWKEALRFSDRIDALCGYESVIDYTP